MPKLSYANVMSTIAVFLALGGTSYAVARNSVGTKQLRNASVTSGKIRNATIQRKDMARAARVGSRGPRGPVGIQGARGPSDGYIDVGAQETILPTAANVAVVVAQLDGLPAGSYLMAGQVEIGDFANAGSIVGCDIRINGQSGGGSSIVIGNGAGSTRAGVTSQQAGVTQAAAFKATLECRTDQSLATPPRIIAPKLSAVRVETLKAT